MKRVISCALALAAIGAACAPDPVDTYSAPDAPPATRPPLPTTTPPPPPAADGDGTEVDDAPETTVATIPVFEANGEVVEVRSLDNSFIQATIEIEAGTEVNWINGGRNDHNILPVDESLTWGVDRDTFVPGTEFSLLFDEPGVFPYYCSIHGTKEVGMVGAVIVTAPA